jgi:fructosamine-3-kinase
MGAVPQSNDLNENWVEFFISNRLLPLIRKCEWKGYLDEKHFAKFDILFSRLSGLFPPSSPCLLHGDLWNGNLMCNENSEPVFIDPGVYYGHSSIDIGMTMLFGGFDKAFSDAYLSNAKPDDNFSAQCEISNLYPLLIHLYLFGSSYKASVNSILNKYTS